MKAGTDLDELVALGIFEFEKIKTNGPLNGLRIVVDGFLNKETGEVIYSLPKYSTDISAAWDIVEKFGLSIISKDGGYFADQASPQFAVVEDGDCWDEYNDGFGLKVDNNESWYTTAPLAICAAALKIKGLAV